MMGSEAPRSPLVTVVIPTYNRPDHLRRAIASVKNQKDVFWEIIVVDDASDPGMIPDLKSDKEILYLRNDRNRGGGYSRNRGLARAKGKYVQFLDDDDELLLGKLRKQVDLFESTNVPNPGLVTCHILDRRSGHEMILKNSWRGDIHRVTLRRYTVQLTSSMLFLTEAVKNIGGFDESLASSQEYDLTIRLSMHYQVDYVDEVLARANRSENQINTDFDKKREGTLLLFRKYDQAYRDQGFFFWLGMRFKLFMLLIRFQAGKWFGEAAYQFLIRKKQ